MRTRVVFMSFGMILALAAASFAGGSSEKSTSATSAVTVSKTAMPIVSTQVTLTASAIEIPTGRPLGEMPLFQEVEKRTNIKIDWQMIPQSAAQEKINLMLSSQDYPDFMWHPIANLGLPQSLGDKGVIVPISDYMDYAPNFKSMLQQRPEIVPYITNPDGKIYSFPLYRNRDDLGSSGDRPYINYTWLKKLGLNTPTTPDELYTVLKAFKTQDPNGDGKADEIPLSLEAGPNNDLSGWIALFGAWGVDYTQMVKDGKVVLGQMQPGYKEGLKFYNKLYKEGLLDPESFTQNREQLRAKTTVNGTFMVGAFRDYVSWLIVDQSVSMYFKGFTDPTPNPNIVYDILLPLKGSTGKALWPRDTAIPDFQAAAGFVTKTSKYKEAAVRWLDLWMDGTEYGYSAEEGLKGTNWTQNDKGEVAPNDPPKGVTRNDWRAQNVYDGASHWWSQKLLPQVPQYGWVTQAMMVNKLRPFFDDAQRFPKEYFPLPAEEETINRYWQGILLYISENTARFITGDLDIDKNWDSYLAGFKPLGLDEVLKAYQARYDRFVQASKK